jgi:major vault protein
MPTDLRQQQDLVLAPGEYVFALDTTKGTVSVFVGPYQSGVSGNIVPVTWDGRQFVRMTNYDGAIMRFVNVAEGEYVELTNPAKEAAREHPQDGTSNGLIDLNYGRRVVIAGPAYFALWPRQAHKIIQGHQLRTNQYLVARVYNDTEALANWDKAVIKKAQIGDVKNDAQTITKPETLTTGQLLIIKGTEVSFYIPPTGIEVVPDKNNRYVRDAVTLERMEYCILLDENGNKRFVRGPDVVFPSPTESFVEINANVKFRPVELNPNSGLYIKVIANYKEGETEFKEGQELFITGGQQAIYYPRPEHSVISYGDQMIHFAVAVPKGEGRYVLNRNMGEVSLKKGPVMLLPDPRHEVVVRRVLDNSQVGLWYPGNQRAMEFNQALRAKLQESGEPTTYALAAEPSMVHAGFGAAERSTMEALAAGTIKRRTTFTPPRTLTLDTKFEGVPAINVWPGFAVLVVDKSGNRRVVEGPAAILLEYDEALMPMELSTGTPKSDAKTIKTVYLQIHNNRVSDKVENVETKDLVRVNLTVAYRVNFEGDNPLKWFDVDNYVRFLTEHLRSLLRNAVKQHGIEEFYKDPITIIRDAILGKSTESGRPGRVFPENGMRVYEVDILGVFIEDANIASLLEEAQSDALQNTLAVAAKERELDNATRVEDIDRQIASERAKTRSTKLDLEIADIKKQLEKELATLQSQFEQEKARLAADQEQQRTLDTITAAELARKKAEEEQRLALAKQEIDQALEKLRAETDEVVKRAGAVDDKLIAALEAFGNKDLVEKVAGAMAPLAILRNSGVLEVLGGLLKGTGLEETLSRMSKRS